MLDTIRFWLCAACLFIGLFFEGSALFGVFRFHYVMNRLHASALGDTMGLFFVFLGLILFSGWSFISLKLAVLVILFWTTSPISSHMIARLEFETYESLSKEAPEWRS